MKILHICLASFYIDNYSYQENLLPKYHKKLGFEVEILASLVSFDSNGKLCLLERGSSYYNEHDILVTRLEYKKLPISKKLRQYDNTKEAIFKAKPDVIFIHGLQFLDIKYVVMYAKKNPKVKIYVDNHADFSNSALNWVSKNILHKIIWKYSAYIIKPYTEKFYGVLPARVEFLNKIYKVPKEKIELLVMGADDEKVEEAKNENIKREIREKYKIKNDDFLIITGGKIDNAKRQTLLLMKAVKQIKRENVKLIIFGSVVNELKEEVNALIDGVKIQYIGWINSEDSYKYFASADLGVFPGRHSVLWEQAIGTGLPCVFKHWVGTTHVDLGGNCEFIYKDSVDEIYEILKRFINDDDHLSKMKLIAETKGMEYFSYKKISSRAIEM